MREAREEVCEEAEVVHSDRIIVSWAIQELRRRCFVSGQKRWESLEKELGRTKGAELQLKRTPWWRWMLRSCNIDIEGWSFGICRRIKKVGARNRRNPVVSGVVRLIRETERLK
jgi:hypothetical protein